MCIYTHIYIYIDEYTQAGNEFIKRVSPNRPALLITNLILIPDHVSLLFLKGHKFYQDRGGHKI